MRKLDPNITEVKRATQTTKFENVAAYQNYKLFFKDILNSKCSNWSKFVAFFFIIAFLKLQSERVNKTCVTDFALAKIVAQDFFKWAQN